VAIAARRELHDCDGFRAESPRGLLGFVEETWLGPDEEPAALALRLLDGRRGLLLAADVQSVVPEREHVLVRDGVRVLELGAPHLVGARSGGPRRELLAASWETTGELLQPPQPPNALRQALLELRPWRLKPPRSREVEQPLWHALALLFPGLALLIALEITLAFAIAYLVTGRAY
jgi:hypothetical protein